MPPRIQPLSLHVLCMMRAALMVADACHAIDWEDRHDRGGLVEGVQTYFLSHARPLYDQICNAVTVCRQKLLYSLNEDTFLSLVIHDGIRTLNLGYNCFDRRSEEAVISMVREKLVNLVELDARGFVLTDAVLEAIGRTCNKLEKITILWLSHNCKLSSLLNLLDCPELRYVDINYTGLRDLSGMSERCLYIAMLITRLPKLVTLKLRGYFEPSMFSNLESVTQLQKLDLKYVNAEELAKIVRLCPQVFIHKGGELTILAQSSLRIETLRIYDLRCARELTRLLELKGGSITKLELVECNDWAPTLEDICVIGSSCPVLEELEFSELGYSTGAMSEARSGTRTLPESPMFRRLTLLTLKATDTWDLKVLLLVITHADRLTNVTVVNGCTPGSADILSEILDANALTELESLTLESFKDLVSPPVSTLSLERLLQSCPKLSFLYIQMPIMQNVLQYVNTLEDRVKRENLNFRFSIQDVGDEAEVLSSGDFDSLAS